MMRKPAQAPPALVPKTDRVIMTRTYKLITPLFGGGVEAGKVDTVTPIRGSSIRGQLRFWWRATRGGRYSTVEDLKKAEGELWGSTSQGSRVDISIVESNPGRVYDKAIDTRKKSYGQPIGIGEQTSDHGYVAFPLREIKPSNGNPGKPGGSVNDGVTFTVRLAFPAETEIAKDIRATLWAWDTFGGIGARTRRGFGALACQEVKSMPDSVEFDATKWRWEYAFTNRDALQEQILKDAWRFVIGKSDPANVPLLGVNKDLYCIAHYANLEGSPLKVWLAIVNKLKAFRQERDGVAGRSHWPEPDAIRDRTEQRLPAHTVPRHPAPLIGKFPRAAFGLPIIFKFKDGATDQATKTLDPRTTRLEGDKHARYASPLILRPLACANNKYVGLAVILYGSKLPDLMLKEDDNAGTAIGKVDALLSCDELKSLGEVHNAYGKALKDGVSNVLLAFLKTL